MAGRTRAEPYSNTPDFVREDGHINTIRTHGNNSKALSEYEHNPIRHGNASLGASMGQEHARGTIDNYIHVKHLSKDIRQCIDFIEREVLAIKSSKLDIDVWKHGNRPSVRRNEDKVETRNGMDRGGRGGNREFSMGIDSPYTSLYHISNSL
ncbi:hypothetical protein LCGC14_1412310 [marine sediment metagenome]|uniref:Uncharacterized protein n=1 Tax=marine sediment metagenome TaxID=412755 RepID=A0A0F9MVM9_9ZZZZ